MTAKVIPLNVKKIPPERTIASSTIKELENDIQYLSQSQQFNARMLVVADLLVRSVALEEIQADELGFLLGLVEGAYKKGMALRLDLANDNS